MKKLLVLLALSIALIGCQNDKTLNNAKYAVIRNANTNLTAKSPKTLVEIYNQDGNYLDAQEYTGYIFNSAENEKEILLYGENEHMLIYNKESNEFSNSKTTVSSVEKMTMNLAEYLVLNNAGYHDQDSYNSRVVLYDAKHQEINRIEKLKSPEQIMHIQMTDKEIITFNADLNNQNPNYFFICL